ncbi:MAG: hypothetical protein ACR2K2_12870 [Mycobacteriales bacterium]
MALVALLAGCGAGGSSSPPAAGPPVSQLRVGLSEYRLQLSAGTLVPGTVTVLVTNAGSARHDVQLMQAGAVLGGSRVLSVGEQQSLALQVAADAPISLRCTLPGHAEAGMTGTLAVAAG